MSKKKKQDRELLLHEYDEAAKELDAEIKMIRVVTNEALDEVETRLAQLNERVADVRKLVQPVTEE